MPDDDEAASRPLDAGALIASLVDPRHCPVCSSALSGPVCGVCGADFRGPSGQRLWALSHQAASVLQAREQVLGEVRRSARPGPGAAPADAAGAAGVAGSADTGSTVETSSAVPASTSADVVPAPPVPSPAGPSSAGPSPYGPAPAGPGPSGPSPYGLPAGTGGPAPAGAVSPPAPPAWPGAPWPPPHPPASGAGIGFQTVLFTLGGLLLGAAVLFFAAVAWSLLPLAGRAVVLAGLTVVAVGISWLLRSRLRGTAETVASIGVVLLLTDAWALHRLDVLGLGGLRGITYAAGATAVLAVLLTGWAVLARLRAPSLVASVFGPAAAVMAGVAVAVHTHRARDVALGFLGAAAVSAVRRFVPERLTVERVFLVLAGVAGIGSAAVATGQEVGNERLLAAALLFALCGAATALQGWADGPQIWSPVAGAFAASAVVPLALWVSDQGEFDRRVVDWPLIWVPMCLVPVLPLAVLVGRRVVPSGERGLFARPAIGAVAVWGLVLLPAAGLVAVHLGQAAGAGVPPWQLGFSASVGRAGRTGAAGTLSADESLSTWPAVILAALLVAAVAAAGLRWSSGRLRNVLEAAAVVSLGISAALAPLAPRLPLAGSVLGLITVAVCATVAAATLREHERRAGSLAALAVAALTGVLAVLLAWATEHLSVPVTVLGVAALLLARAALSDTAARALLAVAATAAGLVSVGATALWLGFERVDGVTAAGAAGCLLLPIVLSTVGHRGPGLRSPGTADEGSGSASAAGPGRFRAGRPWGAADRWLVAAVAVIAVVVGLLYGIGDEARGDRTVLLGFLLFGVLLVAARPHPVLRNPGPAVAGQASALVTTAFAGSLCVDPTVDLAVLVVGLLLALGAAAAVARGAAAPASLALRLTERASFAALAYRCGIGAAVAGAVAGLFDVWPAEVRTLPLGAVLLVAGSVRLARDPGPRSWRPLTPGLLVTLVPPLVLSLAGFGTGRPVLVLILGGAAVAVGAIRKLQAPLLLGSVVLVLQVLVLIGPYVAAAAVVVPFWITGGIVGLTLLTLGAMYEFWITTSRTVARRVGALR